MNHSESLSFEAFQRGVEVEELRDDGEVEIQPRPMPVQALDHSAGYLLVSSIWRDILKVSTSKSDLLSTSAPPVLRNLGCQNPTVSF